LVEIVGIELCEALGYQTRPRREWLLGRQTASPDDEPCRLEVEVVEAQTQPEPVGVAAGDPVTPPLQAPLDGGGIARLEFHDTRNPLRQRARASRKVGKPFVAHAETLSPAFAVICFVELSRTGC
jgi:hypothetical protein